VHDLSKYTPAEPEALRFEPLKAAAVTLARPENQACGGIVVLGVQSSSPQMHFLLKLSDTAPLNREANAGTPSGYATRHINLHPGAPVCCRHAEDSRNCQSSTATSAKLGDLPFFVLDHHYGSKAALSHQSVWTVSSRSRIHDYKRIPLAG
jgi:hypothetical protein